MNFESDSCRSRSTTLNIEQKIHAEITRKRQNESVKINEKGPLNIFEKLLASKAICQKLQTTNSFAKPKKQGRKESDRK